MVSPLAKIENEEISKPMEFVFNESLYSLRRQDMIIRVLNDIAFEVSALNVGKLREYYAALKRLFMELTIIFSDDWISIEQEFKIDENVSSEIIMEKALPIGWKKPREIQFVERFFDLLDKKITAIEQSQKIEQHNMDIFRKLEYLEMYLRKMKQTHGMGVKREVSTDDEERLEHALGNN